MAIPKFHDERLAFLPEKFFVALGHFQYAYTSLEVDLACRIRNLMLGPYDPKGHPQLMDCASAVLGGMRMAVATDTLKRLLRVLNAPTELTEYVSGLLGHLAEISYFRNRLTHYHTGRWLRKRGKFINTDIEVAKESARAITYEALDAARHDLHALTHYLDLALPDIGEPIVLEPPAWQYTREMLTH